MKRHSRRLVRSQRQSHLRIRLCRVAHGEESDTPSGRTPFRSGNCAASNSSLIDVSVERSEIGTRCDRRRVLIRKSANFALSVTVRPRTSVPTQQCQTFSTQRAEFSSHIIKLVRPRENMFSAATDLRTRFGTIGR